MKSVLKSVLMIVICAALLGPALNLAAFQQVPVAHAQGGILANMPGVQLQGTKIAGQKHTPKNGKNFVVGLSMESVDHPALQSIINDCQAGAKEYGWTLLVTDGGGDPEKQVAGIEDMVSKGIDLLMVQAAKAAPLKAALVDVAAKNIPFMFVGKPIKDTAAFTLVGADNYYIGSQVGPWIVDQLTKKNGAPKGNIVIIEGIPGDETSVDRIAGAMDVLKKYPDIKVVAQQPADYRQPQAVTVVTNILQSHPEPIDGIFAANGDMALGAVVAAKDAGRLSEFWVIGIDGSPEELASIKAGEETAAWAWKPSGKEGIQTVKAYLDGEDYYPLVVSPTYRIDKDNVATSQPSWGASTAPAAPAAGATPAAAAPAPAKTGILANMPGVQLQGDKVAGQKHTPKNGKNFLIGLSLESVDHPSLQTIIRDAQAGAKEYGWDLLVTDGGGDPEKQVAGIEDMVSKGIDLLMVQAAKAAPLKAALTDVAAKNIPFMFVGKPIKGTAAFTLVGADNHYIGSQVGPWIVDQLTKKNGAPKGNIVIIEGIPGDETSVDRIAGAMDEIKKYSDIKVVAQQPADYRQPQAVTVVTNILQSHPEPIDGIFAANGDMSLGAVVAAKDAGRLNEFWTIGIDCSPEELTSIKAGEETACWAWKPSGKEGIETVKAYLDGEDYYPLVVAPTYRVDKDNVATSQPSW